MRTGGQVGFSFGEGVPGRDRRAKAVLMEKQELPLGHSDRSVFVLLGPPNNSPFVIKPASSSCLESWRSLSSLQTEGGSQRPRQCRHRRRREPPPSFLSPRQPPVSGVALPRQRCTSSHHLASEYWHSGNCVFISLCPLRDPSPSLEQQPGSNLHFQLHHLPGRAAHDPLL